MGLELKPSHHLFLLCALALCAPCAFAHDTWVETNTNVYRVGDVTHVDLKLGNHGNDHRDFKLASKLDPSATKFEVVAPDGKRFDLKTDLMDMGMAPKEGYWSATFTGSKAGIYCVLASSDNVVSYAPERSIKSAKTFFMESKSLDRVSPNVKGYSTRDGFPLELVPESSPIAPMGVGEPLALRLYFQGKPLANTKISFIPEGATLKEGFDGRYEAMTNQNGRATFIPKEAKRYLAVAHVYTKENGADANGKHYDTTKYSATLCVYVPAICPCCGE